MVPAGLVLVILLSHSLVAQAWDQSDLEMFDLMEELNTNFYEFLNIPNTATLANIKQAYRKLSMEMHPDRNRNDPEAGVKFRQLSVVYQVLKDSERRERYNEALENGIPDWKTPVFYYRKLRKMSNVEIAALVSAVIITIHFATLWGFAVEKRWTLRERLENHLKRHKASDKKKIAIDLEIEEQLRVVKWPTFMDVLPIALVRGTWNFFLTIPCMFSVLRGILRDFIEKVQKDREERKELKKALEKRIQRKEQQKQRRVDQDKKQRQQEQSQTTTFNDTISSIYQITNLVATSEELAEETNTNSEVETNMRPWSQTEEVTLVRLTNKYPGGFPNRWSEIAQIMGRSVVEVTTKAAEIASDLGSRALLDRDHVNSNEEAEADNENSESDDFYYLSKRKAKRAGKAVSKQLEEVEVNVANEFVGEMEKEEDEIYVSRKKQKASAKAKSASLNFNQEMNGSWTQKEQNELEIAINSFPKGTPQRWQLIAECVPTKTPLEVINRVKFLAEHTRKMKQAVE